jgi:UTP-glucose-1-phosphate uridylyltransferase
MTEALAQFIGQGLTGLVIDGKMHDIGNAEAYRETIINLS